MSLVSQTPFPPVSVLTPDGMKMIHEKTVELLENPGIYIDHDGFLDALEVAGADVDRGSRVTRLPSDLTEASAKKICTRPCLFTDSPEVVERSAANRLKRLLSQPFDFRFGGSGLEVLNADMRTSRSADYSDLERIVRFGNGHPRISSVGGPPVQYAFEPDGTSVPPSLRPIAGMRYLAKHCAKPGWNEIASVDDVRFALELGALLSSEDASLKENPPFLCVKCSVSPLKIGGDSAAILYKLAKHNLPLGVAPMPLAGGTTPVTPASAILVANAEILGTMVAVKAVGSESRQEHLPLSGVMDMQTAVASFSNPNAVLQDTAIAQLWSSFYGAEVHGTTDYIDAKFPGYQSGVERGFKVATSLAAGSVYPSIGQLKSGLVCSCEQACLDIEAFDWVQHYLRGVEVSERTLAIDLVRDRGIGGHFLDSEHTVSNFREELFLPTLADRSSAGVDDMVDAAHDEVVRVLSQSPLFTRDKALCDEIDRMYRAEIARRGV